MCAPTSLSLGRFHWVCSLTGYAVWHVTSHQSLAFLVRKMSIWCTIYSIRDISYYWTLQRGGRQGPVTMCIKTVYGPLHTGDKGRPTAVSQDTARTRITAHGSCPSLSLKDSPAPFVGASGMCWLHYLQCAQKLKGHFFLLSLLKSQNE